MIPKKIIAFAITFAMIGAGLSIVGLNTIAEDAARPFEDVTGDFPDAIGAQPKLAWHSDGSYALAVTSVNEDIWRYDRATSSWGLVAFMSGNADDVFNDVVYDGMTKFYFVGYTLPGPVPLAAEWTHGGPAVVGYTFAIVPELGAFEGVCLADEGGMTDYNIFAVGEGGANVQYNGTSWTARTNNNSRTLTSVWGAPSGDYYAGGKYCTLRHPGRPTYQHAGFVD